MELQSIQEKLNTLLEGSERRIVFWYDEDAAYSEDIEALNINAKTVRLTGNNNFAVKLLLEHQDEENNYLVYAPFKRPEDKENFLADIFYYSKHFHSDKLTQLMGELNISAEYQDTVKKYKKFWTGGNFNKFKALDIDEFNNETIELGILCTLAGVKTLSFEEMLKKTILSGASENPVIKKLESQGIDNVFWKLCKKQYGYIDNEPSIEKFFLTMLVTYMDTVMNGAIPPVWKSFVSKRRNDAIVFIKNIMCNEEWRDFYYDFSKKAGKELNISGLIKDIPLEAAVLSDALCDFDEKIIAWIIEKLSDRTPDEKISGMSIPEICEKRCRSACHFSYLYKEKYQMLTAAYHVLKKISLQRYGAAVGEVLKDYTDNAYLIDTYYRGFYYLLDRTGMDVHMEKLRDLVENMYTNKYLTDSAYKWNMLLTDEAYKSFPGVRQKDFFEHYVSPFMNESGGGRVIVIISDGLRYECAKELLDNLETDEKCDARLEYMLSSLPSETTLGMASLLPNKDIRVDENLDIFVDDMHCTNSTLERQRVLKARVKKSACYEFDYVMQSKH